jgi:hypothetical protein
MQLSTVDEPSNALNNWLTTVFPTIPRFVIRQNGFDDIVVIAYGFTATSSLQSNRMQARQDHRVLSGGGSNSRRRYISTI